MIAFYVVAALMVVLALSFVLPTLLRKQAGGVPSAQRDALNLEVLRDQLRELDADRTAGLIDTVGYDSARQELERRVSEDVQPVAPTIVQKLGKPWGAAALAVLVVALAIGLYAEFGNPAALDPQKAIQNEAEHNVTPEQINAMVDKLALRLKEKPDDAEGWNMLARSYNALGRYNDAVGAYARLLKLVPPNAELLSDYADTLGMSKNKSLQGEPEKIVQQALALDPKNVKALALAGEAAFERRDFPVAVSQWKKILPLVPPDSDIARSVASNVAEAQAMIGAPDIRPAAGTEAPNSAAAAAPANEAPPAAADGSAQVSGRVELDKSLRAQVADTDTVFIFARAVDGPRFPLAVLRKQVKDLPITFTLDDSMSMMPNAKLSNFPTVVVGARISKTGSATPSTGDPEGLSAPVHPGAKDLKIAINSLHK